MRVCAREESFKNSESAFLQDNNKREGLEGRIECYALVVTFGVCQLNVDNNAPLTDNNLEALAALIYL